MMDIKISNMSSVPIYQQVATQIKNSILNGSLKCNDQLPSIRSLSKELEVGIITVKKSYEVLLQEELIYSKGAVGYFVNDIDLATVLSIKKEEYLVELKVIIDNAINDGLNIEDIKDIVDKVLEEKIYDKSE
ncbi:GntR family transcriptional regulator [Gemella haemolysans]|jgi:transcriptional regulator, GntR family|uniref:Transcriptional regulator, GntR family n=1 Tax=Gemella haemolysans TaxID=1379 RepID=A0A134A0V5_9BACL|nr:GntR family transcriptional regulator [Gemella haemolysans]KXB61329.1 transcriptional regulator, GntR family [Gemella haemolysans]MDU3831490.1 GntR family transcriptional regulator [Gemella haemolysans]